MVEEGKVIGVRDGGIPDQVYRAYDQFCQTLQQQENILQWRAPRPGNKRRTLHQDLATRTINLRGKHWSHSNAWLASLPTQELHANCRAARTARRTLPADSAVDLGVSAAVATSAIPSRRGELADAMPPGAATPPHAKCAWSAAKSNACFHASKKKRRHVEDSCLP